MILKMFPNGDFMDNDFNKIQELLRQKADLQARLNLLPYDGTPEIKDRNGKKYLYVRKRVGSRVTSTYVDVYADELYQSLLRYNREARELRKSIRHIDKELAKLGFSSEELPSRVMLNLDFARMNMKANIYSQAVLEGVATTFPQTEEIIENGKVNGVTANDVQKILNLKHAWEFILDKDVIQCPSGYHILCHIAKLVNEGFYADGGRIRGVPVTIGGTSYAPKIPVEVDVIENIEEIIFKETTTIGIRKQKVERTILKREIINMKTSLGEVQVKVCELSNGKRIYPEYSSIVEICKSSGLSYQEVYDIIRKEVNL